MNEKMFGNIIAAILCAIIVFGMAYSLFCFLFRDGRGMGQYGNRGNSYMYDDYDYR